MKRALWLLLGFLAVQLSASAAGLLIVEDEKYWLPQPTPPPRTPPPFDRFGPSRRAWAPLEVTFLKTDIHIKDQFATTAIEEEFYNPNARALEGTFLFPVPKGAQIDKFTMEINGKPVAAELLAADKARDIYEDIVRRLKDPALLEYSGRDLFKVRIFPIEPNSRKRITLSYSQLLKSDGGLVNFMLPLNTEKFSAKPLRTVSLKIDVETRRPLKSIYSPSHPIEIKRHGDHRATIGYEVSEMKPDTDFQLLFAQEQEEVGLNLLTYKTAGEEGYFVLLAAPGMEMKNTRIMPKDVAFVLDTSGSMAGAKLDQAKKALSFCIENLNEGDRFEILRFATEVEPLFDKLADASKEHRERAQAFVRELKPIGGTAIDDALLKALALRPAQGDRPYVVIFLTDGRPTVGQTAEDQITEHVTKGSAGNVRIFCFGIGTDVNTHLLDKITEATRAFSTYVWPEEDIEVKVSSFFTKVKDPVLASPKITFPSGVRVTRVYPSPLPDLFKGEQLIVAGRYAGAGDGAIQIEGLVNGETKKFAYDVKFPETAHDHEFIPRLWATRRVGYLLDEIRLRGSSSELKDEVVDLARKYSIVTPYTAYLIVEDEGRRGLTSNARTFRFDNAEDQIRARASFDSFQKDKEGQGAVAGARSSYSLKAASTPAEAIRAGGGEIYRTLPTAPAPGSRGAGRGNLPAVIGDATKVSQYAEQSRFVSGKTFFKNESKWVDSEVQKMNLNPVRLQFGSAEYFALLKREPSLAAWLALGPNVQFVSGTTSYEVYE